MSNPAEIRELAKVLNQTPPKEPVVMEQGIVDTVDGGGLISVFLSGMVSGESAHEIRYLASYAPAAGDVVWLLRNGKDRICLGKLA